MTPFRPARPLCLVSTHLDDVALSCSHLLRETPAIVVTVFAAAPQGPAGLWDRSTTGAEQAPAALEIRRQEDLDAMTDLGSTPVWLGLGDEQYVPGGLQDQQQLVGEIGPALSTAAPASIGIPLGIRHNDHRAVSDACLTLLAAFEVNWFAYLDLPYGSEFPELIDLRLAEMAARGLAFRELAPLVPRSVEPKKRAVHRYRSQVPALRSGPGAFTTFDASLVAPERYWYIG